MTSAPRQAVTVLRRLGSSLAMMLGLILLAAVSLGLALVDAPAVVVAVLVLALLGGLTVAERLRPGPTPGMLAVIGLLATVTSLALADALSGWLVPYAVLTVCAAVVDHPLGSRLAPAVRAVQLPGVSGGATGPSHGPYTVLVLAATAVLAVLLVVVSVSAVPPGVGPVLLVGMVLGLVVSTARLRRAVLARRRGIVDRAITDALVAHAPEFYVYYSGPVDGDYQIRMWLPYLERLGVRYAVLSRQEALLARAATLTSAPVVACRRLAGLDACMVPSVRAVFYVNTHHQCVDGVRYLDRTHVHLNHGDSDKPSSYHPMIAMFDQVFVAGQAAVDRFIRNGVVVPPQKFVLVGRPQVAGISRDAPESPVRGLRTVLYAPTWRGGVRDMSFSSLQRGELVVQALLDHGVRVVFRPHPYSLRDKESAAAVARIDALLAAAASPQCPHLTSGSATRMGITDAFNASDALVTDVSSVASDYLQSGKPMAVTDLGGSGLGAPLDPQAHPVLRAAYPVDLAGDVAAGLHPMLSDDPLASAREELRSYYLGDAADAVDTFVAAAARTLEPPTVP